MRCWGQGLPFDFPPAESFPTGKSIHLLPDIRTNRPHGLENENNGESELLLRSYIPKLAQLLEGPARDRRGKRFHSRRAYETAGRAFDFPLSRRYADGRPGIISEVDIDPARAIGCIPRMHFHIRSKVSGLRVKDVERLLYRFASRSAAHGLIEQTGKVPAEFPGAQGRGFRMVSVCPAAESLIFIMEKLSVRFEYLF